MVGAGKGSRYRLAVKLSLKSGNVFLLDNILDRDFAPGSLEGGRARHRVIVTVPLRKVEHAVDMLLLPVLDEPLTDVSVQIGANVIVVTSTVV